MAISSYNKRAKHLRIKITKQEMKSLSPDAGVNIVQYAPNVPFTLEIVHPDGLKSHIETQSSGLGEMNIFVSTSGVSFIPTERRYKEDIEKAISGLNIVTEKVTEAEEPRHVNAGPNKGMNLDLMEHTTFVDNPTLDSIDKVRSIMEANKTKKTLFFTQEQYQQIESMMTKRPFVFGSPNNQQAEPRFMTIRNQGDRDPFTGQRQYEAVVGTY
jgi:hypothetical protein